jgi:hypothetical protein
MTGRTRLPAGEPARPASATLGERRHARPSYPAMAHGGSPPPEAGGGNSSGSAFSLNFRVILSR